MEEIWVGLDADDTLWHNEAYFSASYDLFADVVAPYLSHADDPPTVAHDLLIATERINIPSFGYGIKGAAISMIEAAISVSNGQIPAAELLRLIERAKTMLAQPVEVLPGVLDALDALAHHRLVLLTKGDLKDQHRKIDESGLAERFDEIEIIHEKNIHTYERAMSRHGISLDRFVMVGNSVRSDIEPVLQLGAWAIHVPHELTWEIEATAAPVDHPRFRQVESIGDVPAIVEDILG